VHREEFAVSPDQATLRLKDGFEGSRRIPASSACSSVMCVQRSSVSLIGKPFFELTSEVIFLPWCSVQVDQILIARPVFYKCRKFGAAVRTGRQSHARRRPG
jgi:hypothetical protein